MNTLLQPFPMPRVLMRDSYCENALSLENAYLLRLEPDKLLAGFRENAGLDMKGQTRYEGWEKYLIGGHTLGHYLSAMAHAYANAGTEEEVREKILEILKYCSDALLECQANSKGKPGYLFGAPILDPANVELQFDNIENGKGNIITEAWVPWYTMHKILAGVIDTYELTGYEPALTVAKGLGDWTLDRAGSWGEPLRKKVLSVEYGGMNDALYELYKVTGEDKYARAAHLFDEEELFEKVREGAPDVLNNHHANTTIPKFLGGLNRYLAVHGKVVDGETVDASGTLECVKAFWQQVVDNHTYITGGNSEWEHFGRDRILDAERTNCNNETCNVYNMLKLSRGLFTITGERKYADYYENALINAILASQNPKTGMTMYFQPMATGYFKTYGEEFTKFWCCTGSGMENFTKLDDSIYFHSDDTVYVNLYFSSKLWWEEGNLILTQVSDFPESDTARLKVGTFSGERTAAKLAFRIPDWAGADVSLLVNGEEVPARKEKGYLYLDEPQAAGTQIELKLPMELRAHGLPDNEAVFGFKYGPVVLSADLGCEDEKTTMTGVIVTIPAAKVETDEVIALPEGVTREDFLASLPKYFLQHDPEKPVFTLADQGLVFSPHYLRYRERYGIYFYFRTVEEIEKVRAMGKAKTDTVVDTVQPGYGQYENDELHDMQEKDTVSVTNDGTYRFAKEGGSFTYRMAVHPEADSLLGITLRKEDDGKALEIASGDTILFSETLKSEGEDPEYGLRIEIPKEVTARAEKISAGGDEYLVIPITFRGRDGKPSARVCGFIYSLDAGK